MRVDPLEAFQPAVQRWFRDAFGVPTAAQAEGWPRIASGEHTLILAPTGSGKTLAAFLACLDRLMFELAPPAAARCRLLYVSPLKALAVDVERNLRAPIAGIANEAERFGQSFHLPSVAVRTGDTPPAERVQQARRPADIMVSTPESIYLLLTSNARESLRSVRWVIVDEIHALVGTKRGTHLMLSLERLEALVGGYSGTGQRSPSATRHENIQRIGLSATQRPLDEVARFLGGRESQALSSQPPDSQTQNGAFRPVAIVDVGSRKAFELRVEMPSEEAATDELDQIPSGPAAQGPARRSIWPLIQPRLLELVREHRSTIIFVNSRRLAERLAAALNDLAGETLAYAHHGAIARDQRLAIEDALKAGQVPALVATSSLELGIDMGAVDLVIQVEAPPSVASGMQRIGRGGHQVGAPSRGVFFPKYRGDLLACAALTANMLEARIEASRYPRNPLDVLAQQIVAMVAMEEWAVDDLFDLVRRAAPYAELSRQMFEGVLDLLSGRYPSDDFAELRPRLTWDRLAGRLSPREGARRLAVANGGTIPDRGLYGVFLVGGAEAVSARVGELDEEMVFETRPGEVFVLGASSWRVEEITHDRVLVSPAPGEPGKMPFWHGDLIGRPLELGCSIGALVRELRSQAHPAAVERLVASHALSRAAAERLLDYLDEQAEATGALPDDRTVVIERCRDDLGDWRLMILSPFGSRVHAPWALALEATLIERGQREVETLWSDDGIIVRFPESDLPPEIDGLVPPSEDVADLAARQLASSTLFAARFREAAARALLLPRRRPGSRTPLWQQRRRSADLLAVAAEYASFPILLETYRECLQDVFDLPGLVQLLRAIERRELRVVVADTANPSPFAASLLFNYVANYIYDGDAPLAERRAQTLAVDQSQLRELLGEAELRELLDADALADLELRLQHLTEDRRVRTIDGLHDLLLRLGDLSDQEIAARCARSLLTSAPSATSYEPPDRASGALDQLARRRRIIQVSVAGEQRWIAAEDAARYRDALGAPPPAGLPEAFLEAVRDAPGDLAARYARTHGPFKTAELAQRFGLGESTAELSLRRLEASGRLLRGEFRPGGSGREWCDAEVLRQLRQRSLARLRREVEPVEPAALGRFLPAWQGVGSSRRGLDDLLEVIEQLQGAALPASALESDILPARLAAYRVGDLDQLIAAGEVVWVGVEPLGERDGRVALYLADRLRLLARAWSTGDGPPTTAAGSDSRLSAVRGPSSSLHSQFLSLLAERGAQFFISIQAAVGATWPEEILEALWDLVWAGQVTNDSLAPLRAYTQPPPSTARGRRRRGAPPSFRSRRAAPPRGAGRWSLVSDVSGGPTTQPTPTERSHALVGQLLDRHGVLTREAVAAEGLPGGFSAVYPVLKALEEAGRLRRGYFVAGHGATQFGLPAAVDRLRALREPSEQAQAVVLGATDPANPYGAALVFLVDGELAAFLGRGERSLLTWPPADPSRQEAVALCIAEALLKLVQSGRLAGLLLASVDGQPAAATQPGRALEQAGFRRTSAGYVARGRSG